MQDIGEGLWHWARAHPKIRWEVSSYYLASERVLIDPLLPPDGLDWFEQIGATPQHVLLSCRHHDRAAWEIVEAYGAQVHCVDVGAYELDGRGPVTTFRFGDELPGGVVAYEVDAISPDECALHVPAHRALVVADGAIRSGDDEPLQFVSDGLMDDPDRTKAGLRAAYAELLHLDFDRLLLAHGPPVLHGGKRALAEFAGAT